MMKALIYSREGYPLYGTVDDPRLVSELTEVEAIETWQVGLVRSQLAIRLKTVEAVSRLLDRAGDGAVVEVSYEYPAGSIQLKHSACLRRLGAGLQPILVPSHLAVPSDARLVAILGARLGDHIRVTYRLIDRHGAAAVPPKPARPAFAGRVDLARAAEG